MKYRTILRFYYLLIRAKPMTSTDTFPAKGATLITKEAGEGHWFYCV